MKSCFLTCFHFKHILIIIFLICLIQGSDKAYAMNDYTYKTKTSLKMPEMTETSVDNINTFKSTITFVTSYVQKVVVSFVLYIAVFKLKANIIYTSNSYNVDNFSCDI